MADFCFGVIKAQQRTSGKEGTIQSFSFGSGLISVGFLIGMSRKLFHPLLFKFFARGSMKGLSQPDIILSLSFLVCSADRSLTKRNIF